MSENDQIYLRIQRRRQSDPEGFLLTIISCAWDDLNRIHEREGLSENFKGQRVHLRKTIALYRSRISDERWADFIERNPDRVVEIREKGRVVRLRRIHGYNFNYSPK